VHLGEHAPAAARRLLEQDEVRGTQVRGRTGAEDAPGHRHSRLDGEIAETTQIIPRAVGVAAGVLARDLEDAGAEIAQHAHELTDLVPRGDTARYGLAVRRLVIAGARGGEADGAGGESVGELPLHRGEGSRGGWLRGRPLAHRVGPERGVPHVARVVDALGPALDRLEVLRVRLP